MEWNSYCVTARLKAKRVLQELVRGDVGGAAAVAGGGLGPLDVQVEQLHL